MRVEEQPLTEVLARHREAITREWLARTLETYPPHTARFLLREQDAFRNPVGHALQQGLPVLFDELIGSMDTSRLTVVLDSIVRIRAVQDFTPSQAVAFVFLLKKVMREVLGGEAYPLAAIETRIDELALLAFDLFMKCREKIYEIKAEEAARRVHVRDRAATVREQREAR